MSIPDSFVSELIDRCDIVEVIGKYVELKKRGANYVGLCPFHGEKTASFSVSPVKQFYHCFGCGVSGDVIQFLIEYNHESFQEAVEHLAGLCGLSVPERQITPAERQQKQQIKQQHLSLVECLQQAQRAYCQQLRTSKVAIEYLKQRGLTGVVAKKYAIGYAPDKWDFLATVFTDYSQPKLVAAGLTIVKENTASCYDRFRQRIMFPIRNVKGEVIGFGGRILYTGEPKYLNSPETSVFSKGKELYGLFEAKSDIQQQDLAIICEGYMDVVALAQMGVGNAVATLGTACTIEHLKQLLRFTKQIVFAFDGDKAGRNAAQKAMFTALPLVSDEVKLKFLFLPAEHDPDSYIRQHGKEAFSELLHQAVPLSQFILDYAVAGQDLSIAENRTGLLNRAKPIWQQLPLGFFKQQLLTELASLAQIHKTDIELAWQLASGQKVKNNLPRRPAAQANYATSSSLQIKGDIRALQKIIFLLFSDSKLWDALSSEEQSLLYQLVPPFGGMIAWLATEIFDNGHQSWAKLRLKLQSTDYSTPIEKILADISIHISFDGLSYLYNLQDLVINLLIDNTKQQLKHETDAIASQQKIQQLKKYQVLKEQIRQQLMSDLGNQ